MILDTLDNVEFYSSISANIYAGLQFIKQAEEGIALGIHEINPNVRAIVSEYGTVEHFVRGYEAHKHVIDIQYPIIGVELVKWSPIKDMDVSIPYEAGKDRTFYMNPSPQRTDVKIGLGVFAIMFPSDGHSPQHYIEKPQQIKKITIKITI